MIHLVTSLIRRLAGSVIPDIIEETDDEDLIEVYDADGNPLTIPRDLLPNLIESELTRAKGQKTEGPFWVLNPTGMRSVIRMAQASEDEDEALFTIVANTDWRDMEGEEEDAEDI